MQLCSKPRGARGIEPETFRRRGQLLSRPPATPRVHVRRINWINSNEWRSQDRLNGHDAVGRLCSINVQGSRSVNRSRRQVMLPLVCCAPLGLHSTERILKGLLPPTRKTAITS